MKLVRSKYTLYCRDIKKFLVFHKTSLFLLFVLFFQSCTFSKENSIFASLLFLRGLSNSSPNYTIGGTSSGLGNASITLAESNKGEALEVSASSFAFTSSYEKGDSYSVSITAQPSDPSLLCSLTGGEGTVESGDVNTITVDCVPQEYTISGTVSGLASTLYLQNGSEVITINANGSFSFPTTFQHGTSYSVTALDSTSIPAQTCIVTNASGSINHGDVSDIVVSCSTNNYLISGTISGLAGSGLVLQNNSGDNLTVSANGSFAFPTSVASGQTFSVSVATQPTTPAQTCDIFGGSGTVGSANVTSITINCATNKYVVSGSIAGLASSVQLQNNGGDTINVSSNGTFAFPTTLDDLSVYSVSVSSSPTNPWQTCSVSNASGSIASADISNVSITCTTNTYTLGGSIAGLGAGTITLRDTVSGQTVSASSGATSFNFASPISSGASYSIVVDTQPSSPAQTCTVSGANGVIAGGNVTGITVNCSNNYTVSVALSSLDGTGLQLQNNGGDTITVPNGSTSYTFPTTIVDGGAYSVTVLTQPTSFSQTCSVTGGSGTISSANVVVNISCSYKPFNITVGSITGLTGSGLVLQNNSGDDLSIAASDTSKTFATQVNSKSNYSVSILTQPSGQRCSLSASTGQVVDSDVTGVSLSCVTAYTIGGSVSGLSGTVTITNNGSESLAIAADGGFAFPTSLINGETYSATVTGQPTGSPNQTCSITNASGTVATSNITNIAVTCVTDSVPDPTISALTGITNTVSVTANGPTPAAGSQNLCYTTDGSTPSCNGTTGNCSAGTTYAAAFSLNATTTVKAISCSSGYAGSNVVTSNLTFSGTVGTPVLSPTLGTYNNDQSVTITATNATAIYYTTDGSTPACSGTGTLYAGAIAVSADNTMFKAIACANLYSNSAVATTFYNLQVATPTFSLAAGSLDAGTGITLASTTTSSWICYSDSATPACGATANTCSTGTAGTIYTYTGSSTATLQAIGCKSNYLASSVASATYTANTYTIGGSISWNVTPNSGTTDLVLSDGTNSLNVSAGSTSFTFPATASGTAYNVAVTSNPTSQGFTCTASSNTGTITTANVTSVSIACSVNRYHISGTITNLGATTGLTVNVINTSDESSLESVSVTGSSTNWTTATGITDSTTYGVQISAQPEGKTCAIVTSGIPSGTITAAVTNIDINCVTGSLVGGNIRDLPPAALKIPTYQGEVISYAGKNTSGYLDALGTAAEFSQPWSMVYDKGDIYVAEQFGNRIRKIDASANVTTIAGTGVAGYADGNGTAAVFNSPRGMTTDGTYLYISELSGKRIRRMLLTSPYTVTTIAGDTSVDTPTSAATDGIATAARFSTLRGVTTDGKNLYIADTDNNAIRKLELATLEVSTIATINNIQGITFLNNQLYASSGHQIYQIDATSFATSVLVGQASSGRSDGIGTAGLLQSPDGLATDGYNIWLADEHNYLLRRIFRNTAKPNIDKSIYTITGNEISSNIDGKGANASFSQPIGILASPKYIYVASGHKITRVQEHGLVGYWPLTSFTNATTQPTTLYDYSTGTGSDLTNNGATMTSGIYGETNGALEFNGSAYLQGSDTNLPSGNSTRSVCAWVYPTALGTINNVFVGYGTNTSHNSFNLGMRAVTGGAIVTIGVTNSLTSSNLTIDLNTWTHTCGTYDGTKARIYVNGHLTQETTVSSWNTILSGNLYIGRGSGPDTNTLFTGKVADVRIYNRALNDSEINMLAENGEATGMVAYLPFDNGSTDEKGPTGLSLLTTGGSPSNTTGKDGDTDGAKNLGDTIYYDYETTGLPTGSNAHTYCAWGKINSLNTKDRLTRFGTGSPGQTVGLTLSDNGTKVGYSSWGDNVEYTTPVTVPTGEWVHLCGKYDGTTASLYYNGKPVASAAKTWDIVNSVFRISANSADGFIGSVDDVRIYNNALSDSQIRYLAIRVPHGLTYYLDFTGDTNDISGFAQNASNSGATATTDRFGEANSAYSFTGSETITTALADLQRGIPIESNRRTICFRFTISSTPTAGSSYSLFSYGVSSSFNNVIMRYVKNGSGINKIQFNAVSSGQNIDYTVPIATWTHVCGVYSNHNPKIYVNGTLQTLSSSNAGVWNTVLDSIILGQDHQGKLDDVQIYNRTLSASEIQAVYGQ